MLYTLVQSARRNCIDVWPYLTDVLRRITAINPGDTTALEALLPDRWAAAHPEHRLEQREEESREAQARRRRKRVTRRAATVSYNPWYFLAVMLTSVTQSELDSKNRMAMGCCRL
jgi:hypothetical protein